ncbi:hypothetical protein [Thalassotalea fusca]
MLKIKRSTNLSWIAGSLLLLQACGDSYPGVGKYEGNELAAAKSISQYSTVYALEPSSFAKWKEERSNLSDISKLSETELLELQQKFAKSSLIKKAFSSKKLLVTEVLDLEAFVDEEYGLTEQQKEKVKATLVDIEKAISQLHDKKVKADNAKVELERIKAEFEAEEKALLDNFNSLKRKSVQVFNRFTKADVGSRYEPSKTVGDGKPFDYLTYKSTDLSCKEYAISKNGWRKKSYQTYIYASPIKLAGKTYCPIFKTLGGKVAQREAILAKLSDADVSILKQAATANVKYKKLKSELRSKQRNVSRDNPALYETAKSFSFSDTRQLAKLERGVEQANQKLAVLAKTTKEGIKANKVKQLAALLERAKSYYLFEALQNQLEKESMIQPDGTFTLQSGEDFYLVEIDLSDKTQPSATQYALIRMEQFKNQELVPLSSKEFFSFSDLAGITL